ncbi:MAG: histone H1 [Rikenellaceae bacterium]
MENLLVQIKEQIAIFEKESEMQATKGVKAAGTRARKAALEISKLMKEFRKASIEESKK